MSAPLLRVLLVVTVLMTVFAVTFCTVVGFFNFIYEAGSFVFQVILKEIVSAHVLQLRLLLLFERTSALYSEVKRVSNQVKCTNAFVHYPKSPSRFMSWLYSGASRFETYCVFN